jgi:ATP-dependent Clp protease ATP-binding subunit ClpC
MTNLPFTPHIEGVIKTTEELCDVLYRNGADTDLFFHCFLNDLSESCSSIFKKVDVDPIDLLKESRKVLSKKRKNKYTKKFLKTEVRKLLQEAERVSRDSFSLDYIPPEVILMVFFEEGYSPKVIKKLFPVGDEASAEVVLGFITESSLIVKDIDFGSDFGHDFVDSSAKTPEDWIDMFSKNEILSQFAENLNLKALNEDFDTIVDFDGKIDEIATVLCRKKKPNALLVGPAGTGKTSLVEGLASKIVSGHAPELIANKVIYSVSLSSMVAGTEYRGQFEKRLEDFVSEAKKYTNLVLFIDEVHTLVGAGGATNNSLEASNILKPELARGTISCIGATTINEYTNTIKKDSALDRRFERISIREPSKFQMQEILPTITSYYEDFHGVIYTDGFLNNVIDYCEKYIPNKFYPDKAIDIIDHCGAQSKVSHNEVDSSIKDQQIEAMAAALDPEKDHLQLLEKLNSALEKWTGDVSQKTPEVKLCHLRDFFDRKKNPLNNRSITDKVFDCISESLIGQKTFIKNLREKMILSGLGIRKTDNFASPDCFVVSGSRFSGKSYFVELLEDSLDKNSVNVLSYSGVHFSDSYSAHKIASSDGHNTSICEKVLISPNSVIIIDDFHKVSPVSIPLFNQIFKHGQLQMSNGDIADFTNCKIFLTSAVSSSQSSMGFQESTLDKDNLVIHPDILSLVDECFSLKELDSKGLRRLLWSKLSRLKNRLKDNNIELTFNFNYIKDIVSQIKREKVKVDALSKKILSEITPFISERVLSGEKNIKLFVEKGGH